MQVLKFNQILEAQTNPGHIRGILEGTIEEQRGGRYGFNNALRNAALTFDPISGNRSESIRYLEDAISVFKNQNRREEVCNKLEWYIDETATRGWPIIWKRYLLEIPKPRRLRTDIICRGQIPRVDLIPETDGGGSAGWMFRNTPITGWEDELIMPLIQYATAHDLNVHTRDVLVGVYSFSQMQCESRRYSVTDIKEAIQEYDRILTNLGY